MSGTMRARESCSEGFILNYMADESFFLSMKFKRLESVQIDSHYLWFLISRVLP